MRPRRPQLVELNELPCILKFIYLSMVCVWAYAGAYRRYVGLFCNCRSSISIDFLIVANCCDFSRYSVDHRVIIAIVTHTTHTQTTISVTDWMAVGESRKYGGKVRAHVHFQKDETKTTILWLRHKAIQLSNWVHCNVVLNVNVCVWVCCCAIKNATATATDTWLGVFYLHTSIIKMQISGISRNLICPSPSAKHFDSTSASSTLSSIDYTCQHQLCAN